MAEKHHELIDRAVTALKNQDYSAFAACFSEDGKYYDYCPSSNGGDNWFVYGREAIEMFFRNRFVHDHLIVSDPVPESERRASFFGAYDGPYLFSMFEIAETDEHGLIQKAVVHPTA
jgi:hypothetical protein